MLHDFFRKVNVNVNLAQPPILVVFCVTIVLQYTQLHLSFDVFHAVMNRQCIDGCIRVEKVNETLPRK